MKITRFGGVTDSRYSGNVVDQLLIFLQKQENLEHWMQIPVSHLSNGHILRYARLLIL